jgi:hypothetical protein
MDETSRRDFHARADANEELIARVAAVLSEALGLWRPRPSPE